MKSLAIKICCDALDDDTQDKRGGANATDKQLQMVKEIMTKPDILDDMDFDQYAQHLQEAKQRYNMLSILEFIKQELSEPFVDPRKDDRQMSSKELFYSLIGETEETFH